MSEVDVDLVETMRRWRSKPIDFVREVLGVEPDWWQADVLRDLEELDARGFMRIAVISSKGPGKTAVEAWVVLWYMLTHPKAKGAATSITKDNLEDNLWPELAKWMKRSPLLEASFEWTQTSLSVVESPEDWFMSARTWSKDASAEKQADTLAGLHADHVLFVIDEAGGVPSGVAAAGDAGLANAHPGSGRTALFLACGNPTHTEGPLYEAATTAAAQWIVHRVDSVPDNPRRTPRVSVEWAKEQIAKWGWDSAFVRVNVRGLFPITQSDKLLGPGDVDLAESRFYRREDVKAFAKVLGVDVARFGDDPAVFILRQGPVAFRALEFRGLNTMALAGQVMLVIERQRPDAVFVDVGGVGAGVFDRLQQLGAPNVFAVDFGSSATEKERFLNKRTEMWWLMAEWVKARGLVPRSGDLRADLTAPTYKFTRDNRVQLEEKAEIKKRLGRSTDHGDALALTFAEPVFPQQGKVESDWNPWGAP